MAKSSYFLQECSTCGRNLKIRVEYLGKRVVCQHCKSPFRASESIGRGESPVKVESVILKRADRLLAAADQGRHRPR